MPPYPLALRPLVVIVPILVLFATALPAAGQGTTASATFRAVSTDGKVVTDLKAADVSVKLNGKAREVRSVDFVRFSAAPGPKAGGPPPAPAFASNAAADGSRDILVVVDDESISPGKERPLRDILGQMIASLSTNDRIGLLSTRMSGVNIPVTADRDPMLKAVSQLVGAAPRSPTEDDQTCRAVSVLSTLSSVLKSLTRPTAMFFFSSSMMTATGTPTFRVGAGSSGLCRLTTDNFTEVANAAAKSPATPYVVFYIDGYAGLDMATAAAGVEATAGVLGTELHRFGGETGTDVARLMSETSGYYVAQFDVDAAERTGNPMIFELRVARDNVKVRAPSSLAVPKKAPSPREMLRELTAYAELPIRAAGYALKNTDDGKIKVLVLLEPAAPGVKLTSAAMGLYDQKGTLKVQGSLQEAELARYPAVSALVAAPGRYRLRVAATDANGRGGTVDYDLDAQLGGGEVAQISSLVLGITESGAFGARLRLANEPAAIGYVEVYGVPKGAPVEVTLELAASADAPAMGSAATNVVQGKIDDMRIAFGGFDSTKLAPGDYVVRALVSVDGKPAGRTVRTLRKVADK